MIFGLFFSFFFLSSSSWCLCLQLFTSTSINPFTSFCHSFSSFHFSVFLFCTESLSPPFLHQNPFDLDTDPWCSNLDLFVLLNIILYRHHRDRVDIIMRRTSVSALCPVKSTQGAPPPSSCLLSCNSLLFLHSFFIFTLQTCKKKLLWLYHSFIPVYTRRSRKGQMSRWWSCISPSCQRQLQQPCMITIPSSLHLIFLLNLFLLDPPVWGRMKDVLSLMCSSDTVSHSK